MFPFCFLPAPSPTAAGFLVRVPKAQWLEKDRSLFLSLARSPKVSGLGLKGPFHLVFPPCARAVLLKLALFRDWFSLFSVQQRAIAVVYTPLIMHFVFHSNVKVP